MPVDILTKNMAKRVLIFSTAYFPFVGGAEVAVKEITNRLGDFSAKGGPASGWEFDMITARMSAQANSFERVGNVNVYRVGCGCKIFDKFVLSFEGYLKARKLDKEKKYDLFWSIMASQASIAAAFFKKANPSAKLLLTLQEGDEEAHLKRYALGSDFLYRLLIRPWHLLVFKKADYVTTISNYLKERAQKNGVKCPTEIVPNGVDLNKFKVQSSKFKVIELKEKLNIEEGEKVIITVSRLVEKNGVDDLIAALTELQTTNYKLLILGSGPLGKSLKFKVKSMKLEDRVSFLGNISNEDVPKYLAISDVFVRPSLSEGLGNSFLEAMAAGVPIIGTKVGGIPDFLRDGETGLFCEARNPQSIAEKITLLLSDEILRQRLIANARKLVEEKYNWDNIAQKMGNIFEKLAD